MPTRIQLYLGFRFSLLLSGPPFFAALRGTEHLAPRSLRLRSPARGNLRAKVRRRKARNDVAEVGLVELRAFADLTGEEALSQRAKWNEPDPEFLECWYHF